MSARDRIAIAGRIVREGLRGRLREPGDDALCDLDAASGAFDGFVGGCLGDVVGSYSALAFMGRSRASWVWSSAPAGPAWRRRVRVSSWFWPAARWPRRTPVT